MPRGFYRVEIVKPVRDFLRNPRIPLHVRTRVSDAILDIGYNPRRADKHLSGRYYCFWRRRVGGFRIIYRVSDKERTVWVVEICHRRSCY